MEVKVKINGFIEDTQSEELLKLLLSLASNWGDVFNTNKLKVKHLSGAKTNVGYQITWPYNIVRGDDEQSWFGSRVKDPTSYLIRKKKSELLNQSRPMGMAHVFLFGNYVSFMFPFWFLIDSS